MRLTLRKKLQPYTSIHQLAEDLDTTVPRLKRRIRKLKKSGRLSVAALFAEIPAERELESDGLFRLFHEHGRCLVCGHFMREPKKRDIGWGEFKQCPFCQFSAHDLANYESRKKAARDQLQELLGQLDKTRSILSYRNRHRAELGADQ